MDKYINLAKQAVENYIKEEKTINPPTNLPKEMLEKKAGVFVSIYKREKTQKKIRNDAEELRGLPCSEPKVLLRGCIGTFLPTCDNIAQEIIQNAISSASRDNRFSSIEKEELGQLSYSVDVLSEPKLVTDIKNLDAKKDGIIVKCRDGRCGLLLPDLDGIDTVSQQILIACQKAGINPTVDSFNLYKFNVERHKEVMK